MSLQNKIEEIRRKPEHIRLRYAWGATAVSMVFVLFIWGVSLSAQKKDFQKNTLGIDENTLETISGQKDELQNSAENIKSSMDKANDMNSGDSYQKMLESTYSQPEESATEQYPGDSFNSTGPTSEIQSAPTAAQNIPSTNSTNTQTPPPTKTPPTNLPENSVPPVPTQ